MKKFTILTIALAALLSATALRAQVNIGGEPVSYQYEGREPIPFIQTPPLDMSVVEAEDAQWEAERAAGMMKRGRRFGIEFAVDYDVHNSGTWSCLPDGGKLWRLGVECPEALSINFIFDRYRLPSGATLYIYSADGRDRIGGFTDYNNQADYAFATDVVLSDRVVIEYYQPAEADFDGELRLATIVHGYRGPGDFTRTFGESGACQRNTICPEGNGWEDQIRSVFALYEGGWEVCSGAIVNNTANDKTPYALTANHCFYEGSTQITNPSNCIFRFRWESPTCTPTANSSYTTMSGSAIMMHTSSGTNGSDCCLLKLNQPIPDSYDIYYAGWSRSTTASPSAMCIHHPALDIKKISPSKALYTYSYYGALCWRADWSTNACTEPGSSGSPLFDSNHRIVGQLYGGDSKCSTYGTPNHYDAYGRFDISWNYGSSSATRLRDWLDPLNLSPTTWDGYDPNAGPAICNPPTNLTVDYTPACAAELNWQPPAGKDNDKANFTEDVEAHPNFAINSTLNGWSYIDGDGGNTYGMNGYEFPNSGSPMAFIVFNPSATTPPNTTPGATPHSGQKFFASICPLNGVVNNDWLISPLLTNPTTFSFWAKTYTTQYGLERMKVGYSTTGTAQGNFTFLTASPYVEVPAAWTKYEYNLPAGTKYVAINCVSDDSFILMIDDIQLTGVSNPGGKTYNVYRDNALIKANLAETTYTDSGFSTSTGHTWSVKQVCTDGESDPVSATKTACTQTQTWTITATAGSNGSINPSGNVTVNNGANQTFTITPASACYEINQVLVDGTNNPGAVSSGSYTFNNVTANHTITVSFKIKTYVITASAGANGSISPNGNTTVNCGANQTFTITPASTCYEIDQVLVDGTNNPAAVNSGSYTFNNVTGTHTIAVSFKIKTYVITASAGANGSISPNGSVTVNCGTSQTFTFTPTSTCYEINQVLIDGTNNPAAVSSGTYTFNNVTGTHTIAVSFKIKTYVITASAGANGSISPNGNITVNCGASQTFIFAPDGGYEVDEVKIDGATVSITNNNYTFTNVTLDHTIAVTFKALPPGQYTINLSAAPQNGGTLEGAGTYPENSTATVKATANPGYEFIDWKENGTTVSTNATYSFTVTGNRNLVAHFAMLFYTITPTSGANGDINPNTPMTVQYGDDITFNFIPAGGYQIDEVKVDGAPVNFTDDQYTFINVTADHTIHVTFKPIPIEQHTITATSGANGTITPSGIVTVNHGDNQTFFFIPDSGYQPDEVTVDGAPVSFTENQYTFTNVTTDHTIHVTFVELPPDQYTITVIPNDLAWGSVSGGGVYPAGATADIIATPATNYNFVNWTEDGAEVSTAALYSFTVTKDRYLIAWFAPATGIADADINAPHLYYYNDVIYFKNIPSETTVQIFDVCGRAIQQTTLTGDNIPFYYKGFYVVRLINADTTVIIGKIVTY